MSSNQAEQIQDFDDWSEVLEEGDGGSGPALSVVPDNSLPEDGATRTCVLSGKLENMPLPDLAQTLESNRKTGMLEIVSEGRSGSVAFLGGEIVGAWSDRLVGASAVYRLLGYASGDFSFFAQRVEPAQSPAEQPGLPSNSQSLLMEGMRHIDEIERIRVELPGPNVVLALPATPQGEEIFALSEAALTLFTSISSDATYSELQVDTDLCDLELAQSVKDLVDGGFLVPLERERERAVVRLVPAAADDHGVELGADFDDALGASPRSSSRRLLATSGITAGLIAIGFGAWTQSNQLAVTEATPAVAGAFEAASSEGSADSRGQETQGETPALAPAAKRPTCPVGMQLVPAGKFYRGSQSESKIFANATPAHAVSLDAYCLDTHEVTMAQFRECSVGGDCERAHRQVWWPKPAKRSVSEWKAERRALAKYCNENDDDRLNHPVNCVTWKQAQAYCKFKEARLPTEAEWEYAARGADGRIYPWGDEAPSSNHLNGCGLECKRRRDADGLAEITPMYPGDDGYTTTAPVGNFPAGVGQWGHQDLVGNVFEWTADAYVPYAQLPALSDPDAGDTLHNPRSNKGERRVIRGGAFNSYLKEFTNPALRGHMPADARTHGIGFRCAVEPTYQ